MLAFAALAFPATVSAGESGCTLSDGYGASIAAFAQEATACVAMASETDHLQAMNDVRTLTDRAREKSGLPPLAHRTSLDDAATAHALDMAARGYAAHEDTLGRTHQSRVRILDRTGVYGAMGANVTVVHADADAIEIYNRLIDDEVSSENIMRRAFSHGGTGVAEADGRLYVVQLFGQLDGELETAMPIGFPDEAPVAVRFADAGFSQKAWTLDDADGLRVRQGTVNQLRRTGAERGDLFLVIEAEREGKIHSLRGPAISAQQG